MLMPPQQTSLRSRRIGMKPPRYNPSDEEQGRDPALGGEHRRGSPSHTLLGCVGGTTRDLKPSPGLGRQIEPGATRPKSSPCSSGVLYKEIGNQVLSGVGGGTAREASKYVALSRDLPLVLVLTTVSSGAIIHSTFAKWDGHGHHRPERVVAVAGLRSRQHRLRPGTGDSLLPEHRRSG